MLDTDCQLRLLTSLREIGARTVSLDEVGHVRAIEFFPSASTAHVTSPAVAQTDDDYTAELIRAALRSAS